MKKKISYRCVTTSLFHKIFLNDILHVAFKKSKLVAINTWIENKNYYIKINLGKTFTQLEYDDRGKWMEVLKLLNDVCD